MNAIILHGKPGRQEYFTPDKPSPSNAHWLPWLQARLLRQGILTQTPELPDPWQPHYKKWCSVFERQLITKSTALIGHSCGGGFIVQWLSQHPQVTVGDVFLVAPSLGDSFFPGLPAYEYPLEGGFFDFVIDPDLPQRCRSLTVIHSSDDRLSVQKTVKHLREQLPSLRYVELHGFGHFTETRQRHGSQFIELFTAIEQQLLTNSSHETTPKS